MTSGKQKEIIARSLKAYQKQLIEQIQFHNSIEQVASIKTPLVAELYRVEDLLDLLNSDRNKKRATRKPRK